MNDSLANTSEKTAITITKVRFFIKTNEMKIILIKL